MGDIRKLDFNKKRIAVFGCKETTEYLLTFLRELAEISLIVTIDFQKGTEMQVAGFKDIAGFAKEKNIDFYVAKKYSLKSDQDYQVIADNQIDIAFVIGWQRLIPQRILDTFAIGAFGMHGSSMNLPLGRGRSPMNWSIIEGRSVFYTNLFKYDPGVDSGDIVDTFKFQISNRDTAATMHFKNALSMKFLISKNLTSLMKGDITCVKQREDLIPTYYPRRFPENSIINWSQDIINIDRLIRAVSQPFGGAFSFVSGEKVTIFSAQIFDLNEFGYEHVEEGTIVELFNENNLLVKCFGGLLLLTDFKAEINLKRYDVFQKDDNSFEYFPLNKLGFYDTEDN